MASSVFLVIALLAAAGYVLGRVRAKTVRNHDRAAMHSLPSYHAKNVAIWTAVPAFLLVIVWLLLQNAVIDRLLLSTFNPQTIASMSAAQKTLLVSEVRQVAEGRIFQEPTLEVRAAADALNEWRTIAAWALFSAALGVALTGLAVAYGRISARFRARQSVERAMTVFMVSCSLIAIITTLGIISSLLYEAGQFFARVPVHEFLFGLRWEPQIPLRADQVAGLGAFGAVPVFLGTLVIATIAMGFAVPVGLMSAVFLTEFADDRVRSLVKPALEILAGIPTVVYGFFAVIIVAPSIHTAGDVVGLLVSPNSALAAGVVMGIMLIPFVSSLTDDALTAVPRALRDGSLAIGATQGETIRKVLLPAALPGIMGGILLALSRAVGETMIVVMAAGLIASLNINPLDSVTTVTVQIVTLLIGDTEFDNPKTLAAFALGLMLFIVTLILNVAALTIVRRYREKY
jgi:phosphate transport system permease protein